MSSIICRFFNIRAKNADFFGFLYYFSAKTINYGVSDKNRPEGETQGINSYLGERFYFSLRPPLRPTMFF